MVKIIKKIVNLFTNPSDKSQKIIMILTVIMLVLLWPGLLFKIFATIKYQYNLGKLFVPELSVFRIFTHPPPLIYWTLTLQALGIILFKLVGLVLLVFNIFNIIKRRKYVIMSIFYILYWIITIIGIFLAFISVR
jgi:hypothetical protein|tara:strand:- start:811 stop:1215 length:405 start_codon:yes stop_codon:yes gene_type:complete